MLNITILLYCLFVITKSSSINNNNNNNNNNFSQNKINILEYLRNNGYVLDRHQINNNLLYNNNNNNFLLKNKQNTILKTPHIFGQNIGQQQQVGSQSSIGQQQQQQQQPINPYSQQTLNQYQQQQPTYQSPTNFENGIPCNTKQEADVDNGTSNCPVSLMSGSSCTVFCKAGHWAYNSNGDGSSQVMCNQGTHNKVRCIELGDTYDPDDDDSDSDDSTDSSDDLATGLAVGGGVLVGVPAAAYAGSKLYAMKQGASAGYSSVV